MPTTSRRVLDHVAIGCATLEQGVAYIREKLGVEVPAGGKHPRMATHNRLMRVGPDVYFELIAIDPQAPPPERPRWFALDEAWQRTRIAERPRPVAWVARSAALDADLAAHPELGKAEAMTRGELAWRISLREDGALPASGLLPVLIEWRGGSPAPRIPDLGVRLETVRLRAAALASIEAALDRLGTRDLVEVVAAEREERIELVLRTSRGERVTLD